MSEKWFQYHKHNNKFIPNRVNLPVNLCLVATKRNFLIAMNETSRNYKFFRNFGRRWMGGRRGNGLLRNAVSFLQKFACNSSSEIVWGVWSRHLEQYSMQGMNKQAISLPFPFQHCLSINFISDAPTQINGSILVHRNPVKSKRAFSLQDNRCVS